MRNFRLPKSILTVGLCGLVFTLYVAAFACGLTNSVLFENVRTFRDGDTFGTVAFLVCLFFASVTLVYAQCRFAVIVDDIGIRKRGFIRTTELRWDEIERVYRQRGSEGVIFCGDGRRITTSYFVGLNELVALADAKARELKGQFEVVDRTRLIQSIN